MSLGLVSQINLGGLWAIGVAWYLPWGNLGQGRDWRGVDVSSGLVALILNLCSPGVLCYLQGQGPK